jgi:hypothetical protein
VKKSDEDYSSLNKVVADNIDLKIAAEGEVIKRLVELAKEKNIKYIPSHEATLALNDYCKLKGIPNPLGSSPPLDQIPQYNPAGMPAPISVPPQSAPEIAYPPQSVPQYYVQPPIYGYVGQTVPPPQHIAFVPPPVYNY